MKSADPGYSASGIFHAKIEKWCAVLLLLLFCAQVILPLKEKSLAYDEPVWITSGFASFQKHPSAGYAYWEIENAPLVLRIATLPLLLTPITVDVTNPDWGDIGKSTRQFLFENTVPAETITLLARLAILPLSVLMGYLIYRWSRELYGSGLLSLCFFSFSPTMLAYAGIVGTDMAVALGFLVVLYLFYRYGKNKSTKNLIFLAMGLGLALQTKMTALVLLPVLILAGLYNRLFPERAVSGATGVARAATRSGYARRGALFLAICVFVLWAGYDFQLQSVVSEGEGKHDVHQAVARMLHLDPAGFCEVVHTLKLPLGHFIRAVNMHVERNRGVPGYLMGQYSVNGWWYYFPLAFLFKVPLPFLFLVGLAILGFVSGWKSNRKRGDEMLLLIPVVFFILCLMFVRKNLGIRYLLPIWPFLFVFTGRLIQYHSRRWVAMVLIVLSSWQAMEAIRVHPVHLAYFNQIAGGPENGWRYLADSNIDWGQELIHLRNYIADHNIDRIHIGYFGRVRPQNYGIKCEKLLKHQPVTGYVAISVTKLLGVHGSPDDYKWLWSHHPIDKLGYSMFIYRIEP